MVFHKKIRLENDVRAMLIPSGLDVVLAAGNEVEITHRLGGVLTVAGVFGMARVAPADTSLVDADFAAELSAGRICGSQSAAVGGASRGAHGAGGVSNSPAEVERGAASAVGGSGAVDIEDLWAAARTVFDPEIPVNIVDLGLVYRLEIVDGGNVEVDMTLTAPGCSMGPMIADDLRVRLESVSGVRQATVNIVWDPPWNQDMMSQEARMILGLA